MPKHPVNKKIEYRLKTILISLVEIQRMIEFPPEGTLNINSFILNNCNQDIEKATFHIAEAVRQLSYWEAKRGGRPKGFIPERKDKRGRYEKG